MSNGLEEKFTVFCGWVKKITGRPVIKGRRGMNVQLSEPYCVVDLLEAPLIAKDLKLYRDEHPESVEFPVIEQVRGLVLATFQISAFGGNDACECLHRLHASLRTDDWIIFSGKNSFGTAGGDGVQNLSAEFLSAAFENRAQIKMTFYIPVPMEFEADYFTKSSLDISVEDKGSETGIYGKE